jgi:hypothetical protein
MSTFAPERPPTRKSTAFLIENPIELRLKEIRNRIRDSERLAESPDWITRFEADEKPTVTGCKLISASE